ncbi:hypothetical protein LPAF129_02650 [Ligilactobacillus pabuli]|uniref:CRISPR-associated protein Csm6 n=1 Tax=Ligilactobacillus pabuli TaxID=2886039 RepID=A0ABQ5JHV2_9LACO|nr:hypothetical protein [Ligilactobacillus pabuli]GKS80580.1 hypothetical protein LPAF129_02650 [Ligilactobacillus pabuli]
MATLISCVGFTDPIRQNFYGPVMHIVKQLKPEKIVLFFSEGTLDQKEILLSEINGFSSGYKPEIVCDTNVIKNEDTFIFDKMFEELYQMVGNYFSEEENFILNLSSGTPAMETALFSINRILGLNVQAYQVKTPINDSNEEVKFVSADDKEINSKVEIVRKNDVQSRLINDDGEKFEKLLVKQNVKQFLQEYDYLSAFEIVSNSPILRLNKGLLQELRGIIDAIKYQKLLPEVQMQNYNVVQKKMLNAFLIFSLQSKREMTSEVIIRGRNLAEFICEQYLNSKYVGLIKYDDKNVPFLNEDTFPGVKEQLYKKNNRGSFLSFPMYQDILNILGEKKAGEALSKLALFDLRNRIAHNFPELDQRRINSLTRHNTRTGSYEIVNKMVDLMNFVFKVDDNWLRFFDDKNELIILRLG